MLSRRIVLSVVAVVALVLSSANTADACFGGGCGRGGGGMFRGLFGHHHGCCMNDCGCDSGCESDCGCGGGCDGGCGCGEATESTDEAAPADAAPDDAPAAAPTT